MIDEHMLEKRLRHLETCTFEESVALANIQKSIEDLKAWIGNGLSDKISKAASEAASLAARESVFAAQERQREIDREERKLELAEQVEKNREYGAKRDAEAKERADKMAADLATQEAARDRRTKVTLAIVGAATGILGALGGIIAMVVK